MTTTVAVPVEILESMIAAIECDAYSPVELLQHYGYSSNQSKASFLIDTKEKAINDFYASGTGDKLKNAKLYK